MVLILAAGDPAAVAVPLAGRELTVGRGTPAGLLEDDERVSRRHVRVARSEHGWQIEDLASRNGTFVDGRQLAGTQTYGTPVLVRIGRSLLWAVDDLDPYGGEPMSQAANGPVIGGKLRRAFAEIALAARAGDTLCLLGESGAGKEIAAHAFHEARHRTSGAAPFVAVNCAAIPEGLAERLLFGARKGSYSGATADAEGYVQAADGGTIFLDEIAELDLLVQAKLLRVLETREVLPLGASRPKKVNFALCTASHRSLREEVATRRFRDDLYFRLGRPEVRIPPLRERLDEIPWLVERALHDVDGRLSASASFVEACALRPWPGNVRELLREVRRAGHLTLDAGASLVEAEQLPADAGIRIGLDDGGAAEASHAREAAARLPSEDDIRRALAANSGNVRGTARALGVHRNQLRRWLAKQKEQG